jgi:hypothetical protein
MTILVCAVVALVQFELGGGDEYSLVFFFLGFFVVATWSFSSFILEM